MTNEITFHPNPGAEVVLTHSPLVRAFRTVAAHQAEHGVIGLTKSGAWNRHAVDWVVRRWEFPNWTAEKLYTVNKVLNEFDVPPLEYLRVLLTALRLGRKAKGGWALTKPGQAMAAEPEAAFVTLTPAFLFGFDHAEDMRAGTVPMGDWTLWLHAIARMPADGFSLNDLAALLYGPAAIPGWRGPAGGLFSAVAMPLEWSGLLSCERDTGGGLEELVWRRTPLWQSGLRLGQTQSRVVPFRKT
jgi:hypothetical protein